MVYYILICLFLLFKGEPAAKTATKAPTTKPATSAAAKPTVKKAETSSSDSDVSFSSCLGHMQRPFLFSMIALHYFIRNIY